MTGEVENRTGPWSEEEHQVYADLLSKEGFVLANLEKAIPTRTRSQIRTHHYYCDKKDEVATPTRKRKSDADMKSSTKKPKSASKKAAVTATPASKAKSPGRPRSKKGETPVKKTDLKPPSSAKKTRKTPAKKPGKAPSKVEPTANPAAGGGWLGEATEGAKGKFAAFFSREEVQTVLAGIFGFALVVGVKKLFL